MMYVLVNKKSGYYFKKEQANGKCIDVVVISEARIFDNELEAENKARFIDQDMNDGYYVKYLNK